MWMMTKRSVTHATFVIERSYDVTPARVFAAWADPAAKSRWFGGPDDWESGRYELDFRVGGQERASGGPVGGPVHFYEARYQDIVPNQRIIYSYEMHLDEAKISVSLTTVELKPAGSASTRLIFTEQGAYLDGHDNPAERERGTGDILDALGAHLQRELAKT
jgi:uncharacterized protein YndB with AHSA1/START domain